MVTMMMRRRRRSRERIITAGLRERFVGVRGPRVMAIVGPARGCGYTLCRGGGV
jgi:hypothetical protein